MSFTMPGQSVIAAYSIDTGNDLSLTIPTKGIGNWSLVGIMYHKSDTSSVDLTLNIRIGTLEYLIIDQDGLTQQDFVNFFNTPIALPPIADAIGQTAGINNGVDHHMTLLYF